jgi:HEAT repeat protein
LRRRHVAAQLALVGVLVGTSALAQPGSWPPPSQASGRPFGPAVRQGGPVGSAAPSPSSYAASSHELRAHFGADIATRLLASPVAEDRLRGLERAGRAGTDEALALLVKEAERASTSRQSGKAFIVLARALTRYPKEASARTALAALVDAETPSVARSTLLAASDEARRDEAAHASRFELGRETAAIALAATEDPKAIEALVTIVRRGGAGRTAAFRGLAAHPPATPKSFASVALSTPEMVKLAATIGDLRTLEQIRGMLVVGDASLRAAAISAMADLGDMRALDAAAAAAGAATEPTLRIAGTTALVRLGARDAATRVATLIGDDATAAAGIALGGRISSDNVVNALAARIAVTSNADLRSSAITALGRSMQPSAVKALIELMKDPSMRSDASDALSRSPAPGALDAIASMAVTPAVHRLAARAYVVRALGRGDRDKRLDAFIEKLAQSANGSDRAVGVAASVSLGRTPLAKALSDADPRVRRAAAIASLAHGSGEDDANALLDHLAVEKDESTRVVLAVGLLDGDAGGRVPTSVLVERCDSGDSDAPLAALALARRGDDAFDTKVTTLLVSGDATTRAHVARGLAASPYRNAVGRLATAYAFEPDVRVRRILIASLAARHEASDSPLRLETLALAATLDPDAMIRSDALRAQAGRTADAVPMIRGVEWLHVESAMGVELPKELRAMFIRADGLSVPLAFDEDGYAIVPGSPPGEGRVVLAPRLPAYESPAP